jgi:hypothetical protein
MKGLKALVQSMWAARRDEPVIAPGAKIGGGELADS